jgi:hypothetical protein
MPRILKRPYNERSNKRPSDHLWTGTTQPRWFTLAAASSIIQHTTALRMKQSEDKRYPSVIRSVTRTTIYNGFRYETL